MARTLASRPAPVNRAEADSLGFGRADARLDTQPGACQCPPAMTPSPARRDWLVDLALLTLLIGALFYLGLGGRALSVTSEARYAELPREMLLSGDWVTPRLNGVKYFEKPPLFYWVQAGVYGLFGYGSEFVVRAATAFVSLLCALMTYAAGRVLYGRLAGIFAAAMLSTGLLYFGLSRVVLLDMPVALFLAATLFCFILGVHAGPGRARSLYFYAMYVAAAGAVLTKGLIGMLLPGLVVLVWLALTGRWSLLKEARLVTGTILFLALAAPWHILAAERNHDFLRFYFIHEHFQRFTTTVHNRYQPPWFFIVAIIGGWLPWTLFMAQATLHSLQGFWARRRTDGIELFLVLWIALITLFFSISDSKLIPYIMPVFPAIALFFGRYFADAWNGVAVRGFRPAMLALTVLFLPLMVTPFVLKLVADGKLGATLNDAGSALWWFTAAMALAFVAMVWAIRQADRRREIVAALAGAALICLSGNHIANQYRDDSIKSLALMVKPELTPETEVVSYKHYFQDLPFYLDRTVTVVDWLGELEFGTNAEEMPKRWMIDSAEFWKRFAGTDPMVVYMRRETWEGEMQKSPLRDRMVLIGTTRRNAVIANQPLKKQD